MFFDCPFASQCWQYTGGLYDMQTVEYAPDWLLQKIGSANHEEIIRIAEFYGVCGFFEIKRSGKVRQFRP